MKYILAALGFVLIAIVCAFAIIGAFWMFSRKPEDENNEIDI